MRFIIGEAGTVALIFVVGVATGWVLLVVIDLLALLNQWRAVRQIQESRGAQVTLLIVPILPIVLLFEMLLLFWQECRNYRNNVDRQWMEDRRFSWDGRLGGLVAQNLAPWGAGALVAAGYYQGSYLRLGVYLLLAFLVIRFEHRFPF